MISNLINLIFATIAALFPQADPAPVVTLAPAQVIVPPVISTIGGTPVPYGLDCVEDEVIYFTGPDTLACVHVDNL